MGFKYLGIEKAQEAGEDGSRHRGEAFLHQLNPWEHPHGQQAPALAHCQCLSFDHTTVCKPKSTNKGMSTMYRRIVAFATVPAPATPPPPPSPTCPMMAPKRLRAPTARHAP
eukprot:1139753-Pelagomonas_calceolata.AAC.5